jgi:RNA polymerase sigma-70 factor, ECF subfamily
MHMAERTPLRLCEAPMPDRPADVLPADADLVARVLDGDKDAFGALVERYWSMAVALALGRTRQMACAEDVAQEAFLRAYDHLADLREPRRFAGWLGRIVIQQCVDHLRRRNRGASIPLSQLTAGQEPAVRASPEPPRLSEQQRQSIRQAVHQLPAKLQQVVLMRFMADMPAPVIAEQLGQRPGTVRVWLHRAYQRLRSQLAPVLEDQEVQP